jgi:chondroitin 4-sulfotransferase 11
MLQILLRAQPLDRLVSAFHYLRHGRRDSPIVNVVKASLSFTDFVNDALSSPIVQAELHIGPQHLFVVDKRGRLQMDYVGRFERLQRHFDVVALPEDRC